MVIEPSRRRGGKRRRRRRTPDLGGHRPRWGTGDTPDGVHLHQSTGPTPRTTSTKDRHHAANLADPFSHRVGTAIGTSFKRGRPFGLQDTTGSEEFVWQPAESIGSPTTLPHLAKAECPGRGTRRPGLAGKRPRKRGSGAEEQERVEKVRRRRRSPSGRARGGELDPATAGHCRRQGQAAPSRPPHHPIGKEELRWRSMVCG
jgi:hypothetical protein